MKKILLGFIVLASITASAQNSKKTSFLFMAGPLYSSRTNLQDKAWTYNESGVVGFSGQALVSFRLAKKWRLNTGFGMDTKGISYNIYYPGPADGLVEKHYSKTAIYMGIPISFERNINGAHNAQFSFDLGVLPQWRTFYSGSGNELYTGQFSLMAGFYGKFTAGKTKIIGHPVFRYGLSQLDEPLVNDSKTASFHSWSAGIEFGIQL